MKITVEINPGKDIDLTDLTQLLQWAQRCDTRAALLGEAIGSLQMGEPDSGQIMQQISSPIVATLDPAAVERVMEVWPTLPKGEQIEVLPITAAEAELINKAFERQNTGEGMSWTVPEMAVVHPAAPSAPAPTTPEPTTPEPVVTPKKRGRRSAAEIEADAKRYAEALKVEPPTPVQESTTLAWAPGVAVPPGMGAETPNFTAVPQVQPQAPAMPVVPPGPPINGVGGELTVDEMRSACSQMNNVKQGMPYRVLKNFGFFTIEAVPADQRANLVAAMQNELSAVA